MEKRRYAGRRFTFWGSLILMGWAVYELCIRLEAMWGPLKMFYNLAVGEGIPLATALRYVDFAILRTPAFLLGLLLLGALGLCLRNRPVLGAALIPLCALSGLYAAGATSLFGLNLWQALKLLPLALICAGSVVNLFALAAARRERCAPPRPSVQRAPQFESATLDYRALKNRKSA